MNIRYELTEEEFINLKNGKDEGYSCFHGHHFFRFQDEFHKKQIENVKNGQKKVFFFEYLVDMPKDKTVSTIPQMVICVIQAEIVPEQEIPEITITEPL